MLKTNYTSDPVALKTALDRLAQIIAEQIQSYVKLKNTDVESLIKEKFAKQFIDAEIAGQFPRYPTNAEWIIFLLSLVPHIQPNYFESIIITQFPSGGDFAEFGGVKGTNHRSMLPTGETAQFIIAGSNLAQRIKVQQLFSEEHYFFRNNILWLENVKEGEPYMSGRIVLNKEWVDKILLGKESAPRFGMDFPAKHIVTNMQWEDAVLSPQTMQQVNEIAVWLKHHPQLYADKNLGRKVKPGYRVLFYGPSGTGKTLTAALLGKQFNRDVYRIDLSQVVSKYIGETEKNLENVFRKAESKNWILFFDEADALFGKRTNVQSSNDKYANQEVSYLLQRVEDYPGLLILASNFKNNLDDAFIRRFHSLIHFPLPNAAERLMLWKKSMPSNLNLDVSVNVESLARQYELTGASILNAVQTATLQSYQRNDGKLLQSDLLDAIRKEFLKEEKSFT